MPVASNGKIVKVTKKAKIEKGPTSPLRSSCCGTKSEKDQGEGNSPSENKSEKRRLQGVVIDGITYTCAACRAGHRVGVCKHAKERPMRATHPPGRPASGATKKIVCDCPKNCSCARKGCRCPRNCSCTQQMYLLVYVPRAQQAENSQEQEEEEENGTWQLGQQVITDLKGNLLTDEEVEKRQERKLLQKAEKDSVKVLPVTQIVPETQIQLNSSIPAPDTKHCCKASQPSDASVTEQPHQPQTFTIPPQPKQKQGCFCGTSCTCAFCLEHPNNPTSQNLARQQALLFSQQPQQQVDASQFMHMLPRSTTPQINSCVGQQPMFAMSNLPSRPTPASFQQAFPSAAPGYMLAYPMRGHFNRQLSQVPGQSPMENFDMSPAQQIPDIQQQAFSDPNLDFNDLSFDIGDAFIANDGADGWHQLSGENESSLDFAAISNPSAFDTSSWDMSTAMTSPTNFDLASPPIIPQIEPNFLDPLQNLVDNFETAPVASSCCQQRALESPIPIMNGVVSPQPFVSPGVYLSVQDQGGGGTQGMFSESWRVQA